MNIPYVFKRCTKCGEWLVASTYNFHKDKQCEYGLKSQCKKCRAERSKQYYEDNKDKISEYHKQYYEGNKDKKLEQHKQYYENNKDKKLEQCKQYYEGNRDKILEQCKQYYEDNKDKISEYHKQWYENNKDKILEQHKQYYEGNKDKKLEQCKQYYEGNRDKILEYQKQYRENNKDKISEYMKQYHATPQGQVVAFNSSCRRRTREQNQGNGINKDKWLEMMNYFDWKCAYSGQILSKDTRTIDHVKPLNQGGEHEIWNVVPMYRSYNISKLDRDMFQWYKEQPYYSEDRLQKIYEWQEYAYNKWYKNEIVK